MHNLKHPEVIIIYVPGDGQAHMTGARRNPASKWLYTKMSLMPESELNGFLKEMMERMHTVIDLRTLANMKIAGMGNATPIMVITAGVDVRDAAQATAQFHKAILDSD